MKIFKMVSFAAIVSLLSHGAFAIMIVGGNDSVNNTAAVSFYDNVIEIENTSNFDARITAFGFDSDPDVDGLDSISGTLNNGDWNFLTTQTVGGLNGGSFEFGAVAKKNGNPNLLGGQTNSGIMIGGTGVFTFDIGGLDFNTLSNFFVRFQRTGEDGEGSDRGRECVNGDCVSVPEPGTVALLSIGLAGLLVGRRKTS